MKKESAIGKPVKVYKGVDKPKKKNKITGEFEVDEQGNKIDDLDESKAGHIQGFGFNGHHSCVVIEKNDGTFESVPQKFVQLDEE